jgi:sterol desaturase/sphingolipid hydroxylase (fatty acid hydroxylase superfamily)
MKFEPYAVFFFFGFGLLFTALEFMRPARPINYRAVIKNDLIALALYQLLFVPVALYVSNRAVKPPDFLFKGFLELPLPIRVILYYFIADFGTYWFHRLMHGRYLWRIHKWHHSPTYMYWLAGIRATIPQQVLFNLPFIICLPLLRGAPSWVFLAVLAENFFRNDFMHMNVSWRSNWLEWVFVTPRYHHIHHSDDPAHYVANLGSLLTIWDRLFGTYVNPDEVEEISFGTGELDSPFRVAIGI